MTAMSSDRANEPLGEEPLDQSLSTKKIFSFSTSITSGKVARLASFTVSLWPILLKKSVRRHCKIFSASQVLSFEKDAGTSWRAIESIQAARRRFAAADR